MVKKKPRAKKAKHPVQPVVTDRDGVLRFKENRIVSWMMKMLETRGINLNQIALTFDRTGRYKDDYQQLMQLIGYSVSGYGDLSCSDDDVLRAAYKQKR